MKTLLTTVGAALALAACSSRTVPGNSGAAAARMLGTFEGVLDASSRSISFRAPDGTLSPTALLEVPTGSAGWVTLSTTNLAVTSTCPDLSSTVAFGGDVTITNSTSTLSNVWVEITDIVGTGHEACNNDLAVDGVTSTGGGLWSYGTINAGASATRRWRLKKPDATHYLFHGRVIEADLAGSTKAPAPVTGANVTMQIQSADFTWTSPVDENFDHVEIWSRLAGSGPYSLIGQTAGSSTTAFTAGDLLALTAYDFELIAVGPAGATAQAAVVLANQATVAARPVVSSFAATPQAVIAGATTTLSWTVAGATSLTIDNGVGPVTGTSRIVTPPSSAVSTTYALTATNSAGSATSTATVDVMPAISTFAASPSAITSGRSSTLSWTVTGPGTITLSISPAPGSVSGSSGTTSVSPTTTTTYTLTASNAGGSANASTTVVSGDVVVTIDSHQTRPISPYLYGLNNVEFGGANAATFGVWSSKMPKSTLSRVGGNRATGLNWETGYSNCGSDCGYSNQSGSFPNDTNMLDNVFASPGVGAAWKPRVDQQVAAQSSILVTAPILGYVAKDASGSQPIPVYPNHTTPGTPAAAHWLQVLSHDPAGATSTPSTGDGYVYTDDFIKWIDAHYSGKLASGQVQVELDNEPDIWKGTHAEICGTATGTYTSAIANDDSKQLALPFDWYGTRSIDHARYVKATNASSTVWAGGFAGYDGLTQFNYNSHPSGPPTGYNWYFDYLLDQWKAAETTYGRRLVDVFDLHWYVQDLAGGSISVVNDDATQSSNVINARVQSTRSLWDDTYVEGSWINNAVPASMQANCVSGSCPLAVLPNLQASIDAHYPGTRIAIGEYWYGRGGDISAAIANADFLGILARHGVYAAAMWWNASNIWAYNTPNRCNDDWGCTTDHAYKCALLALDVYRNYDGAGARAGDTYLQTTVADGARPLDPNRPTGSSQTLERATAHASMDSGVAGRVVVVAINKTLSTALNAGFKITHNAVFTRAEAWRVTGTNGGAGGCTGPTRQTDLSITLTNAFNATLPAQSVTLFVLKP